MEEYRIVRTTADFIKEILDTECNGRYGNKPEHYGLFIWQEQYLKGDGAGWVGCDNTTGDCWIEGFGDDIGHCLAWLIGEEDA